MQLLYNWFSVVFMGISAVSKDWASVYKCFIVFCLAHKNAILQVEYVFEF